MMRARWFGPAIAAREPGFLARPIKPGPVPVTIGGRTFRSAVEAAQELGIALSTLRRRLGRSS